MEFYDLTQLIHNKMATFPGDPAPNFEPVSQLKKGDAFNTSVISIGSHTGTHCDAPLHISEEGHTVDEFPLSAFIGDAVVLDFTSRDGECIEKEHLDDNRLEIRSEDIVLFKTKNPLKNNKKEREAWLDSTAALSLVSLGVKGIGIDTLSIDRLGYDATHFILLNSGKSVIENLDLSRVSQGRYYLVCLPLKILGGDGAPASAVLFPKKPGNSLPENKLINVTVTQ